MRRWLASTIAVLVVLTLLGVAIATQQSLMRLPDALGVPVQLDASGGRQFVAADGTPLNIDLEGPFNQTRVLPLAQMPGLLRQAFVSAEDHRYWEHAGADWRARLAALWGNLRAGEIQRGASSIGEQVARILHPRPATYWTHWVAGWDANRLLQRFGHARVLAFYLNQVPYANQRRGVQQAAQHYFDRDVGALSPAEQLSLAVMVRSPSRYDPRRHPDALRQAVNRLAARMGAEGVIDAEQRRTIERAPIRPGASQLAVDAGHFVVHARRRARQVGVSGSVVRTTLDPQLQRFVQATLQQRVAALAGRGVHDGAALVVDNRDGAVLAWATTGGDNAFGIDPVTTPRQPGSALKPFVYALAMTDLGWQGDHIIMDTPLAERIDEGVHRYRNYSGRHHGRVSLRYALANSLNIPAVRTAQAVGVSRIIATLQELGFATLHESDDYYGPAIALGDGAVTLHDMVQAYSVLARHGRFQAVHVLADAPRDKPRRVLPGTATSLVADMLSDPAARRAEFGHNSILNLPQPTAVKTGTSSDYHDAWTMGFDNRYTVGVWMGNLDRRRTQRVTGSVGPAPVLRRTFAHLRQAAPGGRLWQSPQLQPVTTCEWMGGDTCIRRQELYLPDGEQTSATPHVGPRPSIARPLAGEVLAIDPRVPRSAQRLSLLLDAADNDVKRVVWQVDGHPVEAAAAGVQAEWPLQPGRHRVSARVWLTAGGEPLELGPVPFKVLGGDDSGS